MFDRLDIASKTSQSSGRVWYHCKFLPRFSRQSVFFAYDFLHRPQLLQLLREQQEKHEQSVSAQQQVTALIQKRYAALSTSMEDVVASKQAGQRESEQMREALARSERQRGDAEQACARVMTIREFSTQTAIFPPIKCLDFFSLSVHLFTQETDSMGIVYAIFCVFFRCFSFQFLFLINRLVRVPKPCHLSCVCITAGATSRTAAADRGDRGRRRGTH